MRASKKRLVLRVVFTALSVAVAAAIFILSAEEADASSALSGSLSEMILSFFGFLKDLEGNARLELISSFNGVLRSAAHMGVFFILAFFSAFMWEYWNLKKAWLAALISSFFYAVSDEIHQIFVPGRAFQFTDVLLDLSGISLAVLFFSLIFYLKRKKTK